MSREPIPVSCNLTAATAASQVAEWSDLGGDATMVGSLPTGARMRFPAELEARVADLARRESGCCAFLDIEVSVEGAELVLEVTSDNAEALPVIALLTGVERG